MDLSAAGRFLPFGPSHLAVLALMAVAAAGLVAIGRRQRGTPGAARFSRRFAIAVLLFGVPAQLIAMLPRHWGLGASLPLQLCDLAWMVTAYALWSQRRWAFALTYYWGLTLTTQAVITPALALDFPSLDYLFFWGAHGLVVCGAIYLTWGAGLHPDWRSYRIAVATTLGWMACVFVFNHFAGTNYGFVNAKPPTPSILDLLGPWPWYVAAEIALVAAVWALITWPWQRRRPPTMAPP